MATPSIAENPLKFLQLLKRITEDPDIASLIAIPKLVRLPKYEAALNAAIQHSKQHGDHRFIISLLLPIMHSAYYTRVLAYACDHAYLTPVTADDKISFKKNKLSKDDNTPKRTLQQYLNCPQEYFHDLAPKFSKSIIRTNKIVDDEETKFDMLDSWARLPGSFESGKRR